MIHGTRMVKMANANRNFSPNQDVPGKMLANVYKMAILILWKAGVHTRSIQVWMDFADS